MEFECQTASLIKPLLNSHGVLEPLCNKCLQTECSNPIRKMRVSVIGKEVEWYVYITGSQAYQVVSCPGFLD